MRDIFISYVEEDSHIATQLAEGLEAAGYSVWYYERDGVPGASYLLQTRAAIEGCQVVILIISPDSVTSEQVTLEVVRAHESKKHFIPLRSNISHVEFTERRPEWAQALGASTSIGIAPENISTVVPRILLGLRKMNISPRPELVTNEMGVITPSMIREATGGHKVAPTPSAPPALARPTPATAPPAPAPAKVELEVPAAKAAPGKKLYLIAAACVAAVIIGSAVFFLFNRSDAKSDLPLTTTAVREEFLNLQAWKHPQNWAVGATMLQIEESPEVGFLNDHRFRDFTMNFQVTLSNGGGAAWALRVSDEGYYLFYLSGPKGMQPNRFVTYLAHENEGVDKMDQVGTAFNTVRPLQEGGVYTIFVKAEKNNFFHQIRIDSAPDGQFDGETHSLGTYSDSKDTFPSGSVGFRTFASEKFSVADLFIYPPGTKLLQ
jgi:hypothetical protein